MSKKTIVIFIIVVAVIFAGILYLQNNNQIIRNSNEPPCTDSDGGKDIYSKGSATYKDSSGITLHVTGDSCAIKNEEKQSENEAEYIQGLPSCTDDNCYVLEGYCGEYQGAPIDAREFIQCSNGCNDGACIRE